MKNFWNDRYSAKEFAYGIEPNAYFKTQIDLHAPGKLLLPAEGEGRNAVYAAVKGWDVYAFDISQQGKMKANKLAEKFNASINYAVIGFEDITYNENEFDMIALIFAHVPPDKREGYHKKLIKYLKPGGQVILEGFSKEQAGKASGGPGNIEMLFSEKELKKDFSVLKNLNIQSDEVFLNEGVFHQGNASVIRLQATK